MSKCDYIKSCVTGSDSFDSFDGIINDVIEGLAVKLTVGDIGEEQCIQAKQVKS